MFISKGKRLDGGYGLFGNYTTIYLLESLPSEERIEYFKELEEKDPVKFKEFCEDFSDKLKELGLL